MRFCITNVYFGPRLNKKVEELHEQYRDMEMLVIPSEEVLNEFVDDLKTCVNELNVNYPRTKAIEVSSLNIIMSKSGGDKHLSVKVPNTDVILLSFTFKKIRGTYDGKDNANLKGQQAPEREIL